MASPPDHQSEPPPLWYVGLHDSERLIPVSFPVLRAAQDANYDMLTTPLTTPSFQSSVQALLSDHLTSLSTHNRPAPPIPLIPALTPTDTPLVPHASISHLLGVVSPWINLCSPDPVIASLSAQVLHLETSYAVFCGVTNVLIPGPYLPDGTVCVAGLTQFARAVQAALDKGSYVQVHVLLPMYPTRVGRLRSHDDTAHLSKFDFWRPKGGCVVGKGGAEMWAMWEAWNVIRGVCKYNPRLHVALIIPRQLPSLSLQSRWYSEPLRTLVFPASTFIPNKHSQPVFSKQHQTLLSKYMRLRIPPWLLLADVSRLPTTSSSETTPPTLQPIHGRTSSGSTSSDPTPAEAAAASSSGRCNPIHRSLASDPTPHLSYIRALQQKQPPRPPLERFGAGYQDYLQTPLQPLADNLESITYEVFEKDPVKYAWYEHAISLALLDWTALQKPTSSPSGAVVIAVAGAGRGPLVTRALKAAEVTGTRVEVWAVEKNPNAYVLLQMRNVDAWGNRVTVVKSDMRAWKGPIISQISTDTADNKEGPRPPSYGKVDILISELLGSLADNELSPECLDGAQHVLNPTHGVSIPSSYTAFLTPISTPRLHADIAGKALMDRNAWEMPYVVMLHQFDYLAFEAKGNGSGNGVNASNGSGSGNGNRAASSVYGADSLATTPDLIASAASAATAGNNGAKNPQVLPAWSFDHPVQRAVLEQAGLRLGGSAAGGGGGVVGGDGANAHNARFAVLGFRCPRRGVCHGLAGYFESVLYDCNVANSSDDEGIDAEDEMDGEEDEVNKVSKVELSTNPVTMDAKSKDMISWFPIFLPIKTPISFPDDSELQVSVWRQTDDRKVWYEWMIEVFANVAGQKIRLGATDLHSSRETGCMM